jgi:hypothetical protein
MLFFISFQKKSITKLSKLSLGSLSAIDKLETQLSEGKQVGVILNHEDTYLRPVLHRFHEGGNKFI